MIFNNHKAYTLVEMLVALAVSAIIIAATYASYEMVATQYHKNMDIANMHTSGRAIMRIIERDVRMAGFEYRDTDAKIPYGSISNPLTIKDSGNKCCDEVTVVYDYYDEESKKAERIRIRYWTEPHTSNKGSRHRLYKQKDILGRNGSVLANPVLGRKEVMADYIEDLQILNTTGSNYLYTTDYEKIHIYDTSNGKFIRSVGIGYNPHVYGSIDVDDDGFIYVVIHKNWKWTVGIIDPKKGLVDTIKPPGRYNRFNPSLGFASDGYLYIDVNSKVLTDVYDVKTKKLIKSVKPNREIADLINNKVDTNKNGMRCEIKYSTINCSNPTKYFGNGKAYSSVKFGPGEMLYAATKYRRDSIDVFDIYSQKLVNQIKVGQPGQDSRSRTYGITSVSDLKASSLVDINLTLRTKNQYGKDRQFKKKDYHGGNFKIDITDKYKRDTFSTTVLVRNLAL